MDKRLTKFLFIGVAIVAVILSRYLYLSYGASADDGASAMAGNNSSLLAAQDAVFPQTIVKAGAPPAPGLNSEGSNVPTSNPGMPPIPKISGVASLVMNLRTGKVMEDMNENMRWPTASLAKLMSATILLDKVPLDTDITVTGQMFAADPGEANLVVGGRYSTLDLLHAMLLPSSNVAAETVATFYGRSNFIAEMNSRAAKWGMADTHYDDPSGISAGDESTAADLAKLAAEILGHYPQILSISRTPQFEVTNLTSGTKFTLRSINEFAGTPDFVGGKTGHTEEADGNLFSIFRVNNDNIIIIVLGSNDRFGDTQKLLDWYKQAQQPK